MTLRDWIYEATLTLGRRFIWGLEGFFAAYSKLPNQEFFDNGAFPWVPAIEADWRAVRAELDALMPFVTHMPNFQDLSKDVRYISQDDGWKTYFFYAYGLKGRRNCRRCPATTKLIKRIPGMKTAFFSILAPGKRLREHRGPYKGVLRLHLALLIPEPAENCGIRVRSETRHWQEGKILIFDDTIVHEAWNQTDKPRVVLFVDVMRPMRFPANLVNAILVWIIALSPFVLGEAGSYLRWERHFEAIVNSGTSAQPS